MLADVLANVLSKNSSASSEYVRVNLVPRLSLLSHNNNTPPITTA